MRARRQLEHGSRWPRFRPSVVRPFVIGVEGKMRWAAASFPTFASRLTNRAAQVLASRRSVRAPLASYLAGFGAAPLAEFVEVEWQAKIAVQSRGERLPNVVCGRRLWSSQSLIAARAMRTSCSGCKRSGIAFTA